MLLCFRTVIGQDFIGNQADDGTVTAMLAFAVRPTADDKNTVRLSFRPVLETWAKEPLGPVTLREGVLFTYEPSETLTRQYQDALGQIKAAQSNIVLASAMPAPRQGIMR